MTRLIGYRRVSTEEQAQAGNGLLAQEAAIVAGVRHPDVLVDIMSDEGCSGKDLDRPELLRLIERIAAGEADGFVVSKIDRLSRSVIDFADILEWATRNGIVLRSLEPRLATDTHDGRLVANLMAVVAEWERETIAARTREGLAALRARGQAISGPAVYDLPELAARIRDMRDSGMTLRAICGVLDGEGVPTLRGGTVWRPSALQTFLGWKRPKPRHRRAQLPEIRRKKVA